jgi:hypothetical protein
VEKAVSRWGLPNGYILGEEGGGACIGGLRYGNGKLYNKNAVGFDAGALTAPARGCWSRICRELKQFSNGSAAWKARLIWLVASE